uniref:Uncharacterized protein n=1 Tax=Anguilla anguilla TaxID=7936 RepID=A0A0E9TE73_ANGAN
MAAPGQSMDSLREQAAAKQTRNRPDPRCTCTNYIAS